MAISTHSTPGLVPWCEFTTPDSQAFDCSNHQTTFNHSPTLCFPNLAETQNYHGIPWPYLWSTETGYECPNPVEHSAACLLIFGDLKWWHKWWRNQFTEIFFTPPCKISTCLCPFRVILTSVFNSAVKQNHIDFKSSWKINMHSNNQTSASINGILTQTWPEELLI